MALIDKDQIRAEIERLKDKISIGLSEYDMGYENGMGETCNDLLAFLDSLPESAKRGYKDCNGCEYNRTIKDQIGWQFRGCFGGEYKGKPIAEIELCPLKVDTLPEQPEVDLKKEVTKFVLSKEYIEGKEPPVLLTARHFYELGCRYTAVMYDDIEHERQRAEEAELSEGLDAEMDKYFESMEFLEHENIFEDTFHKIARHFAEWGAEHLKK